jgi:hypothetical protein
MTRLVEGRRPKHPKQPRSDDGSPSCLPRARKQCANRSRRWNDPSEVVVAAVASAPPQRFKIAVHKLHDELVVVAVTPAIAVDAANPVGSYLIKPPLHPAINSLALMIPSLSVSNVVKSATGDISCDCSGRHCKW